MYILRQLIGFDPKACLALLVWGLMSAILKTVFVLMIFWLELGLSTQEGQPWMLWVALAAILLNFWVERKYYAGSAAYWQRLLEYRNQQFVRNLMRMDLLKFEQMGQTKLESIFSRASIDINQRSYYLVLSVLQGHLMFFCMMGYMLYLSPPIAVAMLVWLGMAGYYLALGFPKLTDKAKLLADQQGANYDQQLSHLLRGFLHLKLHRGKQQAILQSLHWAAKHYAKSIVTLALLIRARIIQSESLFFLLLAFVVFVMGEFLPAVGQQVHLTTVLILLTARSMNYILITIYDWELVGNAFQAIDRLAKPSGERAEAIEAMPIPQPMGMGEQLKFEQIRFSYPKSEEAEQPAFGIGPIDFTIQKGECLFLVGGNGAGKSTLLKVITGLYKAGVGRIVCGQHEVGDFNRSSYQRMFSIIFTDFHLFDELHGVESIQPSHVAHLIELLGLKGKVIFEEGKFLHQGLSTGQRKRLAMLHAFAENKQIYLFDEVASDQDPSYRKFFYEVVLQDLKKSGKTVIAVSHDDHYFHVADRVLSLENGVLKPYDQA